MAVLRAERSEQGLVGVLWWLALGLCLWLYWPGLAGPTLLDDEVNLAPLQALAEQPHYFWSVIGENLSGPLGRPVSMMSFGVEYLLGAGDVRTSKLINVAIHLLNGCLLFWLVFLLVRHLGSSHPQAIALLAATFWLLNPLYVSSTLYLVQRMTLLAATGVFAGCVLYVKARTCWPVASWRFTAALVAWGMCLGFAALAKESGLLLAPMSLIIEVMVLRWKSVEGATAALYRRWVIALATLSLLVLGVLLLLSPERVLGSYQFRDFSLSERLLTQARVLWLYLADFFVPFDRGLGVYHDDIPISRSLIEPFTTWIALLAWLVVGTLGAVAWRRGWGRLLVLGAVLFLCGHLLESSAISLELYFEHRNYIAGPGLALMIAGALALAVDHAGIAMRWVMGMGLLCVVTITLPLARQTNIWSDRYLLHLNAVNQHPQSQRAALEWARIVARQGQLQIALAHLDRVYGEDTAQRGLEPLIYRATMRCLAGATQNEIELGRIQRFWPEERDHHAAIALEALVEVVLTEKCSRRAGMHFADTLWDAVSDDILGRLDPRSMANLARLEGHLQRYDRAQHYAAAWHEREPRAARALLMLAYFAGSQGRWNVYSDAVQALARLDKAGQLNAVDRASWQALLVPESERKPASQPE